jgi:DHA2 family multidrug resistance protein
MAPRALTMMLAFPTAGWLFNRVPPRLLVTIGLLLCLSSGVMMARFTTDSGWNDMIVPQILQGVGAAFVLGPVTTLALLSIPRERMAGAAAIESTTRLLGSTIGTAAFASILTHFEARTWELLRHNVSMSSTVLYKRFSGVEAFFQTEGPRAAHQIALELLGGNVMHQVLSLSYMNLFQLTAAAFLGMLLLSLIVTMSRRESSPAPAQVQKDRS